MPDLFVEEASWVLAEEVYNNLSVHHEKNYKKDAIFRGWDTCEELHDDGIELSCVLFKLNRNSQCVGLAIANSNQLQQLYEKPRILQASKVHKKLSQRNKYTKNRAGKEDRISNLPTTSLTVSQSPVEMAHRNNHRFSFCGEIPDICYDFRPYLQYQEHIDAYRRSHTYAVMQKYRDLKSCGLSGCKLHTALKLDLGNLTLRRLHNDSAKRIEFQPSSVEPSLTAGALSLKNSAPLFYSRNKYNIIAASSFRRYKEEKRLAKDGRRSVIPIVESNGTFQDCKRPLRRPHSTTTMSSKTASKWRPSFQKEKNVPPGCKKVVKISGTHNWPRAKEPHTEVKPYQILSNAAKESLQ